MRPTKVLTMVLAGGIGERLYPLTANRSKPAVPFGGNFRIVDFTLMNCVLSGLRSIHLLTQYHSQSLGHHKNERWNFLSPELGEFVEIVPPKLRSATGFYHGTADALYRNLELLDRYRPDVVLVLSGDHVYRADYSRFIESHLQNDADLSVLTDWTEEREASAFGVIPQTEHGRIQQFVEKPEDPVPYAVDGKCLINLGVYCFQTQFLVERLVTDSKRNTAHDFGKNILPDSLDSGVVMSCALENICPDEKPYWRDVGTIDGYFLANMDLLDPVPRFDLQDPRWPSASRFYEWLPTKFPGNRKSADGEPAGRILISCGCDVATAHVDRSVLSPGVRIGQGSEVHQSILFPGVRIGENVKLERVIVEEGACVPNGVEIIGGSSCGDFTHSPGGVVVVPPAYRFDKPSILANQGTSLKLSRPLPRRKPRAAVPRSSIG